MSVGYRAKFLIKKLARLEEEYFNADSIFHQGAMEVEKLFKQEYNIQEPKKPEVPPPTADRPVVEQVPKPQFQSEGSPPTEEPEPQVDPAVKKLYRQIALKAHPDKLVNYPDGEEKEKLKMIFQNATRFMENNDYASLAAIAIKLDIEVEEFSENDLKKVKEKINIIEDKIHKIEKTVIWKWIFEENKEAKDKLLKALFKFMYDKRNKPNPGS